MDGGPVPPTNAAAFVLVGLDVVELDVVGLNVMLEVDVVA